MKRNFPFGVLLLLVIAVLASGCSNECETTSIIENTNKAIVEKFHAELATGNYEIIDDLLADNYIRHCQAMPPEYQELTDVEFFKGFLKEYVEAVSNQNDHIDLIMADSDKVAYVLRMEGTQTGQMGGLPPSGKDFTLINIVIHRFENGKIAESWVSWDNVSFLSQLGFFPPPMPPTEEIKAENSKKQ